jgi:hypothetical protein
MLTEPVVTSLDQKAMTCRLQEARFVAIFTLTALMAQVIALMALVELEFPGSSSHDSSHAAEQQ